VQAPGGAQVEAAAPKGLARGWLVLVGVSLVGLDQLTKSIVAATLAEGESVPVIGNVLRITHIRNSGAAFGMLRGFGGLFALAALVGVVAFAAILVRRPSTMTGIAAALVAAGALGNLTDRIFRGPIGRGTVVDFVHPSFWPAFNVADSAISIGAVLLIIASFRESPRPRVP
jgi:signal peptidase II